MHPVRGPGGKHADYFPHLKTREPRNDGSREGAGPGRYGEGARGAQPDRYTHVDAPKKMPKLARAAQRRCSAQTPKPSVLWFSDYGEGRTGTFGPCQQRQHCPRAQNPKWVGR